MSLVILGGGLLMAPVAADQLDGDGCGCPSPTLRSSTDIDDVVAARKAAMARALAGRG
jgi:hypothetical protein